jgi:hypothetical protein
MKKFLTFLLIVILVLGGLEAVAISLDKVEYKKSTYLLDDELDQSQTEFESGVPIGNFQIQSKPRLNWTVAQSYTPSKEIQTRIQLLLSRNSTQLTIYPLVVCIREYLTGENIGMLSVEPETVPEFPDFLWIEFDFEDMLMTIPHSYFIVCYTTNETDNCYLWGGKGNNSYPNGQVYFSYDDGATWDDGPPWDTADMCFKTYGRDNQPPNAPTITGPTRGKPGVEYDFIFNTTDPNGDDVYYCVSWGCCGSGDFHTYGPYTSGLEVKLSHSWNEQGNYVIQAYAKDIHESESDTTTFEITMSRNRAYIDTPFLHFLQQHPNLFPILQKILCYIL